MQLIFIRHGQSEANVQGIISNRDLPHPLTEQGQRQVRALRDRLASRNVVAIYTSPILRAQQTAQILAEQWRLPVHQAAALREFDCGAMEGRGDKEAWQAHEAVVRAWDEDQDYDRHIPGGESFNDQRRRFGPFIEQLAHDFAQVEGDVLLIGHGALLHQMLPRLLTNIDRVFTKDRPLGNCAHVVAIPGPDGLLCLEWNGMGLDELGRGT